MNKEQRYEIASYFEKYPDVPKEIILKEDILRSGLRFTKAALEAAQGCREKDYFQFTWDRTTADSMEQQEYSRVPNETGFVGGPYNFKRFLTRVPINRASQYVIDVVDGKVVLCENGTPIADALYPPRPKYYSKAFPDGTLYRDIAPVTNGGGSLFINVFPACTYWGDKEECKFCDINQNTRQRKNMGYTLKGGIMKIEQAAEAVATAFEEAKAAPVEEWGFTRLCGYHVSGGTITKTLEGYDDVGFYIRYVKAIKEKAGNRWPLLLQIAAKTEDEYKRLKDAGVDAVHSNIEVWDKDLFEIVCPGKDGFVGRDEWVKRVVKSVDVFGEGNVNTNFVAGVEMAQPFGFKDVDAAVKSTTEGFEYLMSNGVTCRFNSWCVEPMSALAGQEPPPLDYFIRISKAWYETWKKYDLPAVRGYGPVGLGRSTWYHASHNDWGQP